MIADNNPDRRNLITSSLAFIIYYLAGGYFNDKTTISLQVVNMNFKHPEVIFFFTLAIFIWFFIRYWLQNRGKIFDSFVMELAENVHSKFIKSQLINILNQLDYNVNSGHLLKEFEVLKNVPNRTFSMKFMQNQASAYTNANISIRNHIRVSCRLYCWLAIRRPAFSTHVVPYLLFIWALSLIVINVLNK